MRYYFNTFKKAKIKLFFLKTSEKKPICFLHQNELNVNKSHVPYFTGLQGTKKSRCSQYVYDILFQNVD